MSSRLVHSDTSDVNERTRTRFVHQRQRQRQVKRSIRIDMQIYVLQSTNVLRKLYQKVNTLRTTTTCYVCRFDHVPLKEAISHRFLQFHMLRVRDFPFFCGYK